MHITLLTGTRPDIIKMAPLYWEAKKRKVDVSLVHASQHYPYHLFEGVYADLDLPRPDHIINAGVAKKVFMKSSKLLYHMGVHEKIEKLAVSTGLVEGGKISSETFSKIMRGLDALIRKDKKIANTDIILVHGDTTTCAAGAVAGYYNLIPIGHVEAGLRTFSREPYPEQGNTRIADAVSDLHFAATQTNEKNLLNEGFSKDSIFVVGNTVVDAAKWAAKKGKKNGEKLLKKLEIDITRPIIYYSCHRRENLLDEKRLKGVTEAAIKLTEFCEVVWSIRPGTATYLKKYDLWDKIFHIKGLHPIQDLPNYSDIMYLLSISEGIVSDSGSMQEEAAALGVPCLTLRYVTDRPETVAAGLNKCIGFNPNDICKNVECLIKNKSKVKSNIYGEGDSAKKIIDILLNLGKKENILKWEKEVVL